MNVATISLNYSGNASPSVSLKVGAAGAVKDRAYRLNEREENRVLGRHARRRRSSTSRRIARELAGSHENQVKFGS
jgi:hypothetical protein